MLGRGFKNETRFISANTHKGIWDDANCAAGETTCFVSVDVGSRATSSTVDRIYCCKDIAIFISFLLALISSTCARTAAAIQVTAHEFVILDRTTHLSYWTPFILIGRDIRIHPIRVATAWVIAVIWVEIIIIHWEGCIVLTCPRLKKYDMRPRYTTTTCVEACWRRRVCSPNDANFILWASMYSSRCKVHKSSHRQLGKSEIHSVLYLSS